MIARIEKTDEWGDESEFTIVGATEEAIDDAVYKLQSFHRRDTTYPTARFRVLTYNIHDNGNEQ